MEAEPGGAHQHIANEPVQRRKKQRAVFTTRPSVVLAVVVVAVRAFKVEEAADVVSEDHTAAVLATIMPTSEAPTQVWSTHVLADPLTSTTDTKRASHATDTGHTPCCVICGQSVPEATGSGRVCSCAVCGQRIRIKKKPDCHQ